MGINKGKIAVLFPGQGSQYIGMGKAFAESDPDAAKLMELADSVSGQPVSRLCLEGPMEELTLTVNLQPALTVVDLICWQALSKAGIRPDYIAGHSLGEYSALCAAGVLNVEDALSLVTQRGRLMEREGLKHPGGMRAVLGMNLQEVQDVLAGLSGSGIVTAANHNSEKQVVISGEAVGLDEASAIFAEKGARVIPLNVSIANHSPLVEDAVPDFIEAMKKIDFRGPSIPMFFNVTGGEEIDPDRIRDIMARQIASMVKWLDIMNAFIERDVRYFIEAGPKNVLSGLLRKIVPKGYEYKSFQVESPESLADCISTLES